MEKDQEACGQRGQQAKRTTDAITVLCYGDSNTYGYDPHTDGDPYPAGVRWPDILAGQLGDGYKVIVEGLSGRTTAYDRLDAPWKNGYSYFLPCIASHKPIDYLIFMLGTNDCNVEMGLSAKDIAAGMELLVRTAEDAALELQRYVPKIVVVAPAVIRPELAGTTFEYQLDETSVQKSHDIVPLYKQIAKNHGCLFLDASNSLEVTEIDCEHLTEKGHHQLAELLFDLIQTSSRVEE